MIDGVKLSVNILTWNNMATMPLIADVLKQELVGMGAEIIIVDNGSVDGCQDHATIKNPVNLGISKAKNQGIDISRGDFIMLLDGDVVPVPNSIRLLLKHMEENPDCMAIGFLPNKFAQKRNQFPGQHHEDFCEKLDPIIRHRGHCIYYGMYRRELFDQIRFDEEFGPGYGYEDLDSYMQMEAKGITQWAAGMNRLEGRYYHAINSSINNKNCLGFEEYMRSSMKRAQIFKRKWEKVHVVHAAA